jgi:hypothetical protein
MANPGDASIKLLNAVDDGTFCTLGVLPSGQVPKRSPRSE